jgi:chromosomal replication initiation ATPase DnaA
MRLPLRRGLSGHEEAFVLSASNAAAHAALQGWPTALGGAAALHGPAGSGKSHLARLWAERVGALPFHGMEVALADPLELEGRPLLLDAAETVDDETLFHLLNLAQAPGGAVLLVSRDPPASWPVALPDLRSRLNGLLVLGIQPPDDTVLAAMFRARFAERSLQPADDVIDYLIRRVDRSADSVERIVDLLDQAHAPVTRVLARRVLDESGDLFAPE